MPFVNKLRKLLHRKAWESCTPIPAVTAAGSFLVSDKFDLINGARAFAVLNASSIWMYEGLEDSWIQLPNSGVTGVFAAGACGELRGLSAMGGVFTQTATAGTTTTLTTNRTIVRKAIGARVRVVAGTGIGYEGTVSDIVLGANSVITVTPANGVAFDATTQFQVYGGSLWFFNSGTAAVGFSVYDLLTNAWTARSVTGLPTAWGTDAVLLSTLSSATTGFATGTATAGAATTLTNAGKAWATNMWANYQVRITAGTGRGQIRTIASNTGTVLTVSAAWTVNPDATSVYSIEGNDDFFYLLGNNAVTMYRYSVAGNAWTTLAPVAARAAAPGAGMSANWIEAVAAWSGVETAQTHIAPSINRQNGRYIYSFRGAGGNVLDVYDIAANTWISGVAYGGQTETFAAGSSSIDFGGSIYINKEATGRIFRFDVNENRMLPLTLNTVQAALGGAAVVGNKLFMLPYTEDSTTVAYLYAVRQSAADVSRMLLI
jgi:hypothetical protein